MLQYGKFGGPEILSAGGVEVIERCCAARVPCRAAKCVGREGPPKVAPRGGTGKVTLPKAAPDHTPSTPSLTSKQYMY